MAVFSIIVRGTLSKKTGTPGYFYLLWKIQELQHKMFPLSNTICSRDSQNDGTKKKKLTTKSTLKIF